MAETSFGGSMTSTSGTAKPASTEYLSRSITGRMLFVYALETRSARGAPCLVNDYFTKGDPEPLDESQLEV